jgi:sterol carrier protein 2
MTGIPITNVNNNCSTGSTALFNANNAVKSGLVDCALALGFERMAPGSLGTNFPDRLPPTLLFAKRTMELEETLSSGTISGPGAARMFANAGQEYMDKFGAEVKHLAMIGILRCSCQKCVLNML